MMSGEGELVQDVMVKNVLTTEYSIPIKDVAKKMDVKNVGSAIVTKNHEPIGIVTERDFVRRYAAMGKQLSEPISELMTSPIVSINPSDTVWNAAELMKKNEIHKLVVIEDQKLVGIITNSDLVRLCSVGSNSEMRRICDQILTRMKN